MPCWRNLGAQSHPLNNPDAKANAASKIRMIAAQQGRMASNLAIKRDSDRIAAETIRRKSIAWYLIDGSPFPAAGAWRASPWEQSSCEEARENIVYPYIRHLAVNSRAHFCHVCCAQFQCCVKLRGVKQLYKKTGQPRARPYTAYVTSLWYIEFNGFDDSSDLTDGYYLLLL